MSRPKTPMAVVVENLKEVAAALGVTRLSMKDYSAHKLHRFNATWICSNYGGWPCVLKEAGLSSAKFKIPTFTECPRCGYPKADAHAGQVRCPKCNGLLAEDVEADLEGLRNAVRCINCGWRPERRHAGGPTPSRRLKSIPIAVRA